MRKLAALVTLALTLWVLLATGAAQVVAYFERSWSADEFTTRSALALHPLQESLPRAILRGEPDRLTPLLATLPKDPQRLGASVCGPGGVTLASTGPSSSSADCAAAQPLFTRHQGRAAAMRAHNGDLMLTSTPLAGLGGHHVLIAYDHTRSLRRASKITWLLWGSFLVAGLIAAALTVLTARFTAIGMLAEVRAVLTGRPLFNRFMPLSAQVRTLVDELRREREDVFEGDWSPDRLRQVVERRLPDAKVIVVANREPYIHHRKADGTIEVQHPASGLVTALEPVMRACGGVWVAHGSGNADRETADDRGCLRVPPEQPKYQLKRVWLSPEEELGYYYGFSNEGLWPLCHLAHERPTFNADDFAHYQKVNERFADGVVEQANGATPVVLVQDYHFALLPGILRKRLPRAIIIGFWHIPWPNAERFGICPWPEELLEGMLGCDAMGFHTQQHCNNFLDTCNRYIEARVDLERHEVFRQGHTTHVRAWPISVEWPSRWAASAPSVEACRAAVREELKLPANVKLGVGVDRLDYTKGIEERILAVERLFQRRPDLKGKFVFVQLAAPSRTTIPRYQLLAERVTQLVEKVNKDWSFNGVPAVVLRQAHHEPPEVFRHYRAADVCYVSSIHDGMNLVAKEFVSARDDEQGVLVLSHFTGAARELTEALTVNPYDLERASAALETALFMSPGEQRARMRSMRAQVRDYNVYRWAARMLTEASNLLYRPAV